MWCSDIGNKAHITYMKWHMYECVTQTPPYVLLKYSRLINNLSSDTKEFDSLISISRLLQSSICDLSPYLVLPMRSEQTAHQNHLNDTHGDYDRHLQDGPPLHTGIVTVQGVSMAGLSCLEVLLTGDHLCQWIANTVQFTLPFFKKRRREWKKRKKRKRGKEGYEWGRRHGWGNGEVRGEERRKDMGEVLGWQEEK